MLDLPKGKRPPLPKRYNRFIDLLDVRNLVELLEVAYEETRNEKVYRVLATLRKVLDSEIALEEAYRQEEIDEFWRNPGAWPPAVRVWMIEYRDREMD